MGAVGFWVACRNPVSAQTVRKIVDDTRRNIVNPNQKPAPDTWNDNAITAAWLGHSSVLLNFYGVTILTDPALFKRIGADLRFATIGPKRFVAPALTPRELPPIDLVLLSHAHMDHLDPATLRALPGEPQAISAHDTADLVRDTSVTQCQTLRWGDRARVETPRGDLDICAFEVNHWGARWRHDKYRGYNGYTLEREGKKLIFGGDTAWTESFRSLRKDGPFAAAIMPIGAYQPWICSHCTPEQAVKMANQAGADLVLPMHCKTFPLGHENRKEPMARLRKALEPERLGWSDIGQSVVIA
jgi:L-ascorbate metabolism protein UlaG (beta-lactamase superfamily)